MDQSVYVEHNLGHMDDKRDIIIAVCMSAVPVVSAKYTKWIPLKITEIIRTRSGI